MNLIFGNKKPPIINVIIYSLLGLVFAFASAIPVSAFISPAILLISVAFFSLCTYHIGILTLIPAAVPITAVAFMSDIISALVLLPSVLLALAIGFSLRIGSKPVEKIVTSAIVYIISSLLVYMSIIYITTGTFDISAILNIFSKQIEQIILSLSETLRQNTGVSLGNIGSIIDFIKSIMVGTYISIELTAVCIAYCLAAVISKISKDIQFDRNPLDIRLSTISTVIFLISLTSTLLMNIPTDGIKFYTTLFVNLFFALSPLFAFSGIYYLLRIKFKVEKGNAAGLMVALIMSFVFGPLSIAVYLVYCGASYSLKYNKIEKLKETTNDSEQ